MSIDELETLLLDQDAPRERGRAHGEHWRDSVRELAERRLARTLRGGSLDSTPAVLDAAGACLDTLRRQAPDEAEELGGIAEGVGVDLRHIVVLNAFPDLAQPSAGTVPPVGDTVIYFQGTRGPLLGLTMDLPPGAEPYVRMLRVAPAGGEDEILALTLTGCLASAGVNHRGVAVATAGLSGLDVTRGRPWPAVVRALLRLPHPRAAREQLRGLRGAGGRFFMVANGLDYYGIEHDGRQAVVTQLGPRAAHLHTNHYFDPVLRQREYSYPEETSRARLNLATTLYAQQRPRDDAALWALMHTRDGTSRSLSVDPGAPSDPEAATTAATMLVRLYDGSVRVVRGAEHRGTPTELRVGRWRGPSTVG